MGKRSINGCCMGFRMRESKDDEGTSMFRNWAQCIKPRRCPKNPWTHCGTFNGLALRFKHNYTYQSSTQRTKHGNFRETMRKMMLDLRMFAGSSRRLTGFRSNVCVWTVKFMIINVMVWSSSPTPCSCASRKGYTFLWALGSFASGLY